ncbi:IS4 family transposase [Streptomyces phaeochromogenes]
MSQNSVSVRSGTTALDVYAPGHLGELTEIIDPELVDAVLEDTGVRQQRLRLLPARVVVYFVLALAFFERSSYQAVWAKLTAGLGSVPVARPCASSLARARRQLGSGPLRHLFSILAGPVADHRQSCAFYQGLRLVAVDGTTLSAPNEEAVTWHFRKHIGRVRAFGYPLVRMVALVECGTRALVDAVFGPDDVGELAYARRLLGHLDASMLLLADAPYDAFDFLQAVQDTGAHFVLRSTRKRRPTVRRSLPDGSYLTAVLPRRYRARASGQRVQVRVVEAWLTVVLADGTRRTELWRLLTNLLDADSHPANDLLRLYHRRWQAETCYFSLKSTILDGRVLRSRSVPGLEQEIFALLTVYQALVRMAGDVTTATPGLSVQRVSFTVLFQAAADQIIVAPGPARGSTASLVGAIGWAVLANLLPGQRRQRLKARYRKTSSKYQFQRDQHPRTVQKYTLDFKMVKDGDIDAGPDG